MVKEYSKEEVWKLYLNLPEELKEIATSGESSEIIYEICKRNGAEEKSKEIIKYVGYVLLGVLPPDDFQEILEKELGLEEKVAKKVFHEISRFIFYPVKSSLEELYKIEIAPPAGPTAVPPSPKRTTVPPKEDVYREPIE